MNKSLLAILLTAGMVLSGCNQETADDTDTVSTPDTADVQQRSEAKASPDALIEEADMQTVTMQGRIEFKSFEGGFYAFIANDGSKWTVMGLEQEYQQHGLELTITGLPMPDMMTTTQFGTVLKVESVENVDASNVKSSPADPESL